MDSNLRREIILDNYNNPFHKKVNDNYEKVNTNNESCIDNIDIYFKFNDDVLEDVSFFGEACAISTSATSILLRNILQYLFPDSNFQVLRELINSFFH